jgi:hypothetical protein
MSMKDKRIEILTLIILLVSIALVSAASASADKVSAKNPSDSKVETYGIEGLTAQQVSAIESKTSYLSKLPNTVYNAPYWPILAANDEEKKVYLSYIDKLSVSESEKKAMKKSMSDLWKRFPNGITKDDYPVIKKIGKAILDYLDKTNGESKQSVQWKSSAHSDLISSGVKLKYQNSQWASWASASANDPDNGVIDSGSLRYYNHYYRPKTPYTGGATGRCLYFAQYAKDFYGQGNYQTAFYYLGLASHYLSDVGNPMHTDGEVNQLANQVPHGLYEDYVQNNWRSGYNYYYYVQNNAGSRTVTDPSQAVKSMAAYSNPYFSQLWNLVITKSQNPNDNNYFGKDTDVRYITSKVLLEDAKYNAGLAAYISS